MTDRAAVSVLERAIANVRGELLSLDAKALQAQVDLYAPVRERLLSRVAALEAQLAESDPLSIADALRLDRAQELLRQTEDELARLAPRVEAVIIQYRQQALTLAADHAQGLALVSAAQGGPQTYASVRASWTRLNTGAVEQILGRLSEGSPLRALLDGIGGTAGDRIADALKESTALGINPRDTARRLAKEVDVPAARLLLISRSEQLGSYRSAQLIHFQENSDILSGWMWVASKGPRSCLSCIANHGTTHPLSEQFFKAHPGCRCSASPIVRGVEDVAMETGPEWFYNLSRSEQHRMIPPTARADFDAGRLDLGDFVHLDRNKVWGDQFRQASVAQARRSAARRHRRAA